jgi:sulfate transport system permease protein
MWRARTLDDDQTMTAETAARRPTAPRPSGAGRRPLFRRRSAIPGFGLTMGVTLTVLSLIVLIP